MRWQYSILGLLAFTTSVALYLTFAKHFPWLATVILVGGGMWAGTLLLADRLIALGRANLWAMSTIAAWVIVGTLFLFISLSILPITGGMTEIMGDAPGVLGVSLAGGALICYLRAWRAFLQLRKSTANEPAAPIPPTRSKSSR